MGTVDAELGPCLEWSLLTVDAEYGPRGIGRVVQSSESGCDGASE